MPADTRRTKIPFLFRGAGVAIGIPSSVPALFEHQFGGGHQIGRQGLSLLRCGLLEAIGDHQNMMPPPKRSKLYL